MVVDILLLQEQLHTAVRPEGLEEAAETATHLLALVHLVKAAPEAPVFQQLTNIKVAVVAAQVPLVLTQRRLLAATAGLVHRPP